MESTGDVHPLESQATALVRVVMSELPRLDASTAGAGFAAILCEDAVAAGLDVLHVREWMLAVGGYEGQAYLHGRPKTGVRNECGTPLHPVTYFAVPLAAFEPPQLDAV